MILKDAVEADYAEIVELANLAYRKTGPGSSWNSETGIIEGQRLNESLLREDFARSQRRGCWSFAIILTARC